MTVPHPQTVSPNKDAQAARKRRRRAPAGGAADDCFACIKRGSKCDRRRPYCSQCLEIGNECSGYKTQLTWGVGVASRGKLRGLSLPIAKSPPVAPVQKNKAARSRASSTATSQWSDTDNGSPSPRSFRDDVSIKHEHHMSSSVPHSFPSFNDFPRYPSPPEHHHALPTTTHPAWNSLPAYTASLTHEPVKYHPYAHAHHHQQKVNSPMGHYPMMGDQLSSSVDSLSDVDYSMSPMAHSFPREDGMPFMHSPTLMYDSYTGHSSPVSQSPVPSMTMDQRGAPTSCPSLVYAPSEHGSSLSSHPGDSFDQHMAHRLLPDNDALSVSEAETYNSSPHHPGTGIWPPPAHKDFHQSATSSAPFDGHAPQVSTDLFSKIPFFMDYYENIMCPSMVLLDGPNNPYRKHILSMASVSRSLQHAICALSACNLRMKRRLSLGLHTRESQSSGNTSDPSGSQAAEAAASSDPSLSEELQHRTLAVNLLNQQLNDPANAGDDTVLATILILCHYRMVESGVARFHTQFAGVKKILSMRRSSPTSSGDSAWMEAIFTYLDSMSASVNERDSQLSHDFFGIAADAQLLPPGAENWVGCDRELFKTVSKLGRLNLLSQQRPVQKPVETSTGPQIPSSPLASPLAQSFRFDGNGFSSQLPKEELSSPMYAPPNYDDPKSAFWREWKEVRLALQSWEFDANRLVASLPGSPPSSLVRDLGSVSEAFRYAALLYTERLASPDVPSSHNTFRNLVSQVVYYATSLESSSGAEKFLLWPLFVAGSECVNELQQNIIRNKCEEMMSRSGYMNNNAALDVLSRLWAGEHQRENGARLGIRRKPFNWTRCIAGPGVGVEWIMF